MDNLKDWAGFAVVVVLIGTAAFFLTKNNHERDDVQAQKPASVLSEESKPKAKSFSSYSGTDDEDNSSVDSDYDESDESYEDEYEYSSHDDVYWSNCTEAKSNGAYNIARGEAGYRPELDRDGDGYACEPYYGR